MTQHASPSLSALRGILALAFLAGASSAPGTEAIGLLNDTGQTTCFNLAYEAVPCEEGTTGDTSPLPRQDGRFGRDAAAALGRLTKIGGGEYGFDYTRICMNGDAEGEGNCPLNPPVPTDVEHPAPTDWACLRDNVTRLLWSLGNLDLATWAEASSTAEGSYIQRANASVRCGLDTGWRLPARREGYSLMNAGRKRPNVEPAYFPILSTSYDIRSYWTADIDASLPIFNHVLVFDFAALGSYQCREVIPDDFWCGSPPPGNDGRWASSVLLVNGAWKSASAPRAESQSRWRIREDGLVVTDTATGLMWDRCTWGQTGPGCEGQGQIITHWSDAMQVPALANQRRHLGLYDWRVPNARELESLVKIDAAFPAIDTTVFPNTAQELYWSATQRPALPTLSNTAYCVRFKEGVLGSCVKEVDPIFTPDRSPVRLVRGGHPSGGFDGIDERLFYSDFDGAPAL